MLRVAIVEDEQAAAAVLLGHLQRYEKEQGEAFEAKVYPNALQFLDAYRPNFNIIFMDVEMPSLNGMDAAKLLRKKDSFVPLVFITNMSQYAIRGYEVDAVDYVLKPVSYYRFATLLQKLLRYIHNYHDTEVTIRTPNGVQRILASKLEYVTVEDHLLIYHTEDGPIESWDTLKNAIDGLPSAMFVQCNKSCILNLKHVKGVDGGTVVLRNNSFTISRGRKKDFFQAMNTYYGR